MPETNPDIIYLDDKERTNTNNEDKKQKIATLKMVQVVNQGACTNHFQKNSIKRWGENPIQYPIRI